MKIRFIIYCNHSVISLIISYTCQNFCDNSSSDCHNLERNNNLVMTIFLQLDSEALVNSRMMWIRGTCFSQEGKKERKKKSHLFIGMVISSWVKLRSTNILWLELWSSYSCEEVRHLFDKRDLKVFLPQVQLQHPIVSSVGFCAGMVSQASHCSWTAHWTVCYAESDKTGLKLI